MTWHIQARYNMHGDSAVLKWSQHHPMRPNTVLVICQSNSSPRGRIMLAV